MHHVPVDAPRMVYETLDGEVIVIDLATGAYHNLAGTAAQIWQSIVVGGSREDTTSRVADHYGQESASIQATIDGFLAQLLEEERRRPEQ